MARETRAWHQRLTPSAPLPKFVIHRSNLLHELRKQRGTSKFMILVPLFDLKFLNELAAGGAGTSNRRHYLNRAIFSSSLSASNGASGSAAFRRAPCRTPPLLVPHTRSPSALTFFWSLP